MNHSVTHFKVVENIENGINNQTFWSGVNTKTPQMWKS